MLVVMTTVSALVHLYSWGYMDGGPGPAALLRLSQPVHLRDADAGDRGQSRPDVLRLGKGGPRLLPADQLLVPQAVAPTRPRSRRSSSAASAISASVSAFSAPSWSFRHRLHPGHPRGRARHAGRDHSLPRHALRHDYTALHPPLHRRHGQVRAAWPPHLAAGRDGGPDSGLRPDSRRHDGDPGRVHGLPPTADVRGDARPR